MFIQQHKNPPLKVFTHSPVNDVDYNNNNINNKHLDSTFHTRIEIKRHKIDIRSLIIIKMDTKRTESQR